MKVGIRDCAKGSFDTPCGTYFDAIYGNDYLVRITDEAVFDLA